VVIDIPVTIITKPQENDSARTCTTSKSVLYELSECYPTLCNVGFDWTSGLDSSISIINTVANFENIRQLHYSNQSHNDVHGWLTIL